MKIANYFHYVGLVLVVIGFSRQIQEKNDFNIVLIGICIQVIGLFFYFGSKYKKGKIVN